METNRSDLPLGEEAVLTVPRIVIASSKGRGGKTLATLAILSALRATGRSVTAFKNGPDYIDPSHHAALLGEPCRTLDCILMGSATIERFYRYSQGRDMAVVEGNHGLYDSPDGRTELGSTAHLAKTLGAPVVIVVDGERANRTVGALVRGLRQFDPEVRIPAAILTNVVPRQFDRLTAVVEAEGVTVVGILPRDEELAEAMPYRHLGLVPPAEGSSPNLQKLVTDRFAPRIDVPRLMDLARENSLPIRFRPSKEVSPVRNGTSQIGFLAGRPFTFYYPEMIEQAQQWGSVRFIDPEKDGALPPLDLLVIGGGFPEVYAASLEANRSLRAAVRHYADRGGTIYAECGGLMYLTDSIATSEGEHDMVGLIEGRTVQERRPVGHGYATARVTRDTLIAPRGTVLHGHEFHYSRVELRGRYDLALEYDVGSGLFEGRDGIQIGNVYAHYLHLHPSTFSVLDGLLSRS
jgi:cobyrinic acid a,c-diamide synthase